MDKDSGTAVMVGSLVLAAIIVAGFALVMTILTSEPPPVEKSAGDFQLKIDPEQVVEPKLYILHERGDMHRVSWDGVFSEQNQAIRILVDGEPWPIDNSGNEKTFTLRKGRTGIGFDDYYTPGDILEGKYGDTKPETVSFIEKKPDGSEFLLWSYGKTEVLVGTDFYAQPRSVCVNEPVRFYDASTNNPDSWAWTFGDGASSGEQNPTHSYNAIGDYTVTLTAGDPSDTETKTNYISVQPVVPDFSGTPRFGIEPLLVQFRDLSRCGIGDSFLWTFGDLFNGAPKTSTDREPSNTYGTIDDKVTRYTVTFVVTQNGIDYPITKVNYITVCPDLVADFSISSEGGIAPLEVIFTDLTTGDPNRWQWNFDDGTGNTSVRHPRHTFTAPGEYTIVLTSYNICESDTKTMTIVVPIAPPGHIIRATADPGGSISPSGNVTVEDGSNQSFTITPTDCYYNSDLWVDGSSVGPQPSYTFYTVDQDHTIHANFTRKEYYITQGVTGTGGTISPPSPVPYPVPCGNNQNFTIRADPCYTISNINIDGTPIGPQLSPYTYQFTDVRQNHTIYASFSNTLSITASAGTGGTINPNGIVYVPCGSNRSFTITNNTCYNISDIIIDGQSTMTGPKPGPNTTTFTNITTNHVIRAEFAYASYAINASAGPGGTITDPGITIVPCGSSKSYTITANPCYRISNVIIDGVSIGAQNSPYTRIFSNVQGGHTISATFQHLGPFTITSSAVYLGEGYVYYPAPAGSITPTPACSNPCSVICGNNQGYFMTSQFTVGSITYILSGLTVDGEHMGAINPYTFTNVQANHTIIAEYTPTCYFAEGFVRDRDTGLGISGVRLEIWNRQRTTMLWYSITRSDGSYVIPIMLSNGDKYDINIGNNTPAWTYVESHLIYEGQDAGLDYSVWRDDCVFNPGGKCKTTLNWRVKR